MGGSSPSLNRSFRDKWPHRAPHRDTAAPLTSPDNSYVERVLLLGAASGRTDKLLPLSLSFIYTTRPSRGAICILLGCWRSCELWLLGTSLVWCFIRLMLLPLEQCVEHLTFLYVHHKSLWILQIKFIWYFKALVKNIRFALWTEQQMTMIWFEMSFFYHKRWGSQWIKFLLWS